ncbi:beta-carotene 15,15'-monooxygenase [Dokdonia pacifica]|uniref:Uncharacterized membrane protein n=1 Tax=Dokdonia pacifica TaxID=1627892 RepID=A0A239B096_9FLAO|nr:DUF819 family protein [Dokdonia pacifica]GGG32763.1 beta-carotene 15,15'-monooxygenase [Dokdonia pacifica]SNS01396.1 Uncharacterized membrane protein [Dokdonia pacifica]
MAILENPVYVLLVLLGMVILSVYAAKTKLGKKLGVALIVILFTAVIANLKLIPSASNSIPLYSAIFTYLAPISIFYLLLNVNLTSIKRAGAPMIILFLIGSLATTLGILISWYVISPQQVLGDDASIIAGMLTGTYTGGSVNFNAVALEYNFQERGVLYAGTIAIDNVVTTLWIIVTLAFPAILRKFWKDKKISTPDKTSDTEENETINFHSLMWLLFLGLAAYFVSDLLATYVPQIPSMITISTLGILLAQIPFVARLKGSQTLGLYLVYIFLAVIGAYCELSAVVELKTIGLTLLGFTAFAVLLHGIFSIFLGGLIYKDWDMIAIVSQANIGGGTTAIALAETFKRKELLLPAILVGSLGNAVGTYLGFMVVYIL